MSSFLVRNWRGVLLDHKRELRRSRTVKPRNLLRLFGAAEVRQGLQFGTLPLNE
jgi:hypothetical protein